MPRGIGPFSVLIAIAVCSFSPARAEQEGDAGDCDKQQYTLFNPTPERCMRDFEPDHPDLTSNPFTIDAGHIEFETTVFSYLRSARDNDGKVEDRYGFVGTDIRVGVLNNFELGVEIEPFNIVNDNLPGFADEQHIGPDTVALEAKLNLFGNEDFDKPGSTALAVLAVVDVPTVSNGIGEEDVEGSIAFPFAIRFTKMTELEMMTKYDIIKSDGPGYHVEYFNSGSFGVDWTSKVSNYFELATRFGNEDPDGPIVILGLGGAYKPTNNFQLDYGVNIGLTDAADRFNPFVGAVKRF
jgi:hypothetical protein